MNPQIQQKLVSEPGDIVILRTHSPVLRICISSAIRVRGYRTLKPLYLASSETQSAYHTSAVFPSSDLSGRTLWSSRDEKS